MYIKIVFIVFIVVKLSLAIYKRKTRSTRNTINCKSDMYINCISFTFNVIPCGMCH